MRADGWWERGQQGWGAWALPKQARPPGCSLGGRRGAAATGKPPGATTRAGWCSPARIVCGLASPQRRALPAPPPAPRPRSPGGPGPAPAAGRRRGQGRAGPCRAGSAAPRAGGAGGAAAGPGPGGGGSRPQPGQTDKGGQGSASTPRPRGLPRGSSAGPRLLRGRCRAPRGSPAPAPQGL